MQENEVFIIAITSTKIKGSPTDEYPVVRELRKKHGYTVKAVAFKGPLSRVVLACAKNEIRQSCQVYILVFYGLFSVLVFGATDSYRLAEKKLKKWSKAQKRLG